jgi:hypothetical protein
MVSVCHARLDVCAIHAVWKKFKFRFRSDKGMSGTKKCKYGFGEGGITWWSLCLIEI